MCLTMAYVINVFESKMIAKCVKKDHYAVTQKESFLKSSTHYLWMCKESLMMNISGSMWLIRVPCQPAHVPNTVNLFISDQSI